MNVKDEKNTLLKKLDYWNTLTEQEKEDIISNSHFQTYQIRELLKGSNEKKDCRGWFLVKTGILRVYILSPEGRDVTLYRMKPYDVCVLSASCLLSTIDFDVFIESETNAEVLIIPLHCLEKLIKQNINVECYNYKMATMRFSDVMWSLQQILFMGVDKRIALFLLNEADETQSTIISMTHEQIAHNTGSAREVVTRMLNYFVAEKMLSLSRGAITITDKKKLQKLLD